MVAARHQARSRWMVNARGRLLPGEDVVLHPGVRSTLADSQATLMAPAGSPVSHPPGRAGRARGVRHRRRVPEQLSSHSLGGLLLAALEEDYRDLAGGLALKFGKIRIVRHGVRPQPVAFLPHSHLGGSCPGLGTDLHRDLGMCHQVVVPVRVGGFAEKRSEHIKRSPSVWYISGLTRGLPLLAPLLVSNSSEAPNGLSTCPALARNSAMTEGLRAPKSIFLLIRGSFRLARNQAADLVPTTVFEVEGAIVAGYRLRRR
jgi:hypothetical protein